MKLHSVSLNNIKSFLGVNEFDFSDSDEINTISGINGSGKTSIFKSVILAQKIFFAELYNKSPFSEFKIDYSEDLLGFFLGASSYISLTFIFEDQQLASFIIHCQVKTKEAVKVKLICEKDDFKKINQFWNIHNPGNIIIYIDSNRNISENDFSNENLELKQSSQNELALEYIFNPEKIFFSTYDRIISDYIRERVIPSTPRADLPHYVSKILIHDILNYLKISKFTGLERQNQFILQAKNESSQKTSLYDIRNLSSGEKTLFYIYHFICYVKNIGMLIIDEPENNLHENMLSKFVLSLKDICFNDNFSDLILDTALKNKIEVRATVKNQIIKFYKNHKLSQIFLLTHSKNLIYNNFILGKNYVINKGFRTMEYDSYEKTLREIGLSKIVNKVLFVEGKNENEILESILLPYNIKVKALGGCSEVIETYRRYLSMKEEIRDVQFCFMIDKDMRTDDDIQEIRMYNESFFDEHFIIMDRHEIENYFLDSTLFHELFTKHKAIYSNIIVPSLENITKDIRKIADLNKDKVLRKRVQNLNRKSLSYINAAISIKSLPIDTKVNYENYIDNIFTNQSLSQTINTLKSNYESISNFDDEWNKNWIKICDGKAVFHQYLNNVSKMVSIHKPRTINELQEIALSSSKYEINTIVNSIIKILS